MDVCPALCFQKDLLMVETRPGRPPPSSASGEPHVSLPGAAAGSLQKVTGPWPQALSQVTWTTPRPS